MVGFLCGMRAYEYVSLPVLSWYTISLVISSSLYEDLILSGGSISDFRPNFCVALEVLKFMFVETDNFFEDCKFDMLFRLRASEFVPNGQGKSIIHRFKARPCSAHC
jgi:hypothetical protein